LPVWHHFVLNYIHSASTLKPRPAEMNTWKIESSRRKQTATMLALGGLGLALTLKLSMVGHGATESAGFVLGLLMLWVAWLAIAHARSIGINFILSVFCLVWVADIAAYFGGRALGRRKLAPSISPGKSWEGAYGAVAGVCAYGLACLSYIGYPVAEPGKLVLALVGLVAFTAVSIIGDLFESLVKRQAGVKDSGTLLPGHGGILDRIDSLTSTLPLAALVVLWIAQ